MADPHSALEPADPAVPRVVRARYQISKDSRKWRSELAEWLASPANPLTARVMANRVWQFRMGRGIEGTPNDFGVMGQHASNQALLDWLASEFVAKSWSVKSLDRLIVLSSVYQQRSVPDAARQAAGEHARASGAVIVQQRFHAGAIEGVRRTVGARLQARRRGVRDLDGLASGARPRSARAGKTIGSAVSFWRRNARRHVSGDAQPQRVCLCSLNGSTVTCVPR